MPTGLITISQYITNPAVQLSGDDELEVRGWYTNSFIGGDGVTPISGNFTNGQQGPFYSITPTLNGSGYLVVPAHEIQATTLSNPTANYIEQLWVNGSLVQVLMPNNQVANGWQIPTVYGDPIAFDEIATYNRARRLLYPPNTYFTADQVIQEIERLAGNFDYMAVSVNGIGQASVAPAVASVPIVYMVNDPHQPAVTTPTYYAEQFTTFDAAVSFIGSARANLNVSKAVFVHTDTAIPSTTTLVIEGDGIIHASGGSWQLTVQGPLVAPPVPWVGQNLTVFFTGNGVLTSVYPEWWGAGVGELASTNTIALNAASTALTTIGSGTVLLGGGTYDFDAQWLIGATGSFTGISVQGSNGYVGSTLNWTGATNVVAVKFIKGRMNKWHDVALLNGVAKGTTVGLQFTSPASGSGAGTFYADVQRTLIRGFQINLENGNSADVGADADLMVVKNVSLEEGDIGLRVSGFNSTTISCDSVDLFNNANTGAWFTQIQQVDWKDGAIHGNGTTGHQAGFYFADSGIVNISGVRDEYPDSPGYRFLVVDTPSFAQVHISHCFWAGTASAPWTHGLIHPPGAGTLEVDNCNFSQDGGGFPITPVGSLVDGEGGAFLSIYMHDNAALSSVQLYIYNLSNSQPNGTRYRFKNNVKVTSGNTTGWFDDEEGIVNWPNKKSLINLGSGLAATPVSPGQISSNQNNYAILNPDLGTTTFFTPIFLRLSTDAPRNITGLVAGSNGQLVYIINVGPNNIVLKNEDTNSTEANRFHNTTGADITLAADQEALLIYDLATIRWRVSKLN